MKKNYNHTVYACFIGYITQAIVNNFAPLLFLTFQSTFGISLDKITFLITLNFAVQLAVDLLSAKYVDRIGYRVCVVAAHIFAVAGLAGMAFLPALLPDPYIGLVLSVICYAIGGGIIEVLISPIVEACPTDKKEAAMSLLHSFYCWGHVFVILASTCFFFVAGIENWRLLALFWALVPLFNAIYFCRVPVPVLVAEHERISIRSMIRSKFFWVFLVLMICAGASEQSMSQWASAFAESGLHVSKTVGDLAGPCAFAVLMGSSRLFYARYSERIKLQTFMAFSAVLCIISYLIASLSPYPGLGLVGCALCGLSVGIMWPGTFSLAVKHIPGGGTAMFALFALGGDLGCGGGPTVVGIVSNLCGENLRIGILAGIVFPILLLLGLRFLASFAQRSAPERI